MSPIWGSQIDLSFVGAVSCGDVHEVISRSLFSLGLTLPAVERQTTLVGWSDSLRAVLPG